MQIKAPWLGKSLTSAPEILTTKKNGALFLLATRTKTEMCMKSEKECYWIDLPRKIFGTELLDIHEQRICFYHLLTGFQKFHENVCHEMHY